MRAVFLCALAALPALVSASSAWNDFVTHTAPVEAPKGSVGALNLATTFANPAEYSKVTYIQPQCSSGSTDDDCRAVTVNKFIGSETDVNKKICTMCKAAALGTDFYSVMAAFDCSAVSTENPVPPQCMTCLAKGFGTTEATPGFYLPCGCQGTCVDVSGNSTANFAKAGLKGSSLGGDSYKFATSQMATTSAAVQLKYAGGYPLSTCQDYITNKIVLTCNQISIYHFVLWPSVLGGAALIFTAMSMAYMQLDMDSLLYTVGSSGKKDN